MAAFSDAPSRGIAGGKLEPGGAVLSTWSDDPWARGAYTISPPGGHDPALGEMHDRIVLAGEHTAGPLAGLMEGALASGARPAAQVLTRT